VPIDVPGDGTVLNTSVFEFPADRSVFAFQLGLVDDLPGVPALPETLLAMEFQLQEFSVDLRAVSEIVLGDLGATIQVLRLAGREYGDSEGRPVRIEDCISDLGLKACLRAAAAGTMEWGNRQRAVVEMWEHSREIAHTCRLIAEETPGFINPHQAYMAGLLHGIGALPALLGWERSAASSYRPFSAVELAERWAFPPFLKEFFQTVHKPGWNSQWSKMLSMAHRFAETSACCSQSPAPAQILK
jgi:HD-like signal output (HDOD) protein